MTTPILFRSPIETQRGLDLYALRDMAKSEPESFMRKLETNIQAKKISLSGIRDIKELWRAFVDVPVNVTMPDMSGAMRTIKTSAFPIITGSLVISQINQAYLDIEPVTQNLVTELDDNKKVTTIVGVSSLDNNVDEVKELDDFPEISASEEKVEIRHRKNGRRLTVSAETISENDMPNLLMRVNDLGRLVGRRVERQTILRVIDYYGSANTPVEPYVYRPAGTGTQLYNATANNPGTRAPSGTRVTNNALDDETDLEAARIRLNTFKDDNGERIGTARSRIQLFIPDALVDRTSKIMNSTYVPGVENEKSNWGPGGRFNIPSERIVTTPLLDDYTTTAWYMGDFKSQFIRKWKMRFEYVSLGMETQAYLNAQIAAQFRVAWDVEIGARDYVFVIENLSATTPPNAT